jgi:alpha-D-xyloside xylohydrolase
MKKVVYILIALFLFSCSTGNMKKNEDGISVIVKDTGETVKLTVFSEDIIRVTVSKPGQPIVETESLIAIMLPDKSVKWETKKTDDGFELVTSLLKVSISQNTGEVKFYDETGNLLLAEQQGGGRKYGKDIDPELSEGSFQKVFESPDDEAFYGLGQHQNGEVNYKGLDVELLQHNIVAVVPFVYSNKKYGILWDNYSITRFGDPRNYKQINALKLFDADNTPGGLTATYYDKGENIFVKKTDNFINYSTLDHQDDFPEGFKMDQHSKIVWEGSIGSDIPGVHKFKLYVAGYWKVWIDGELIIDKWRQVWNPWHNKFYVDIKSGETRSLKIEWKPDADVSYCGLTFLDPSYGEKQNMLSLFSEAGKQIDYYFIKGNNADEVISGYRDLTGKAPIVPKWAMGLWQSRERYRDQKQLVDVVKEYRKRKIPFDNIVLDWNYWPTDKWGDHDFDPQFWPEPEKMVEEVHALNSRIMISVWPKFYVGTNNFNHFKENGWLFMKNVEKGNLDWIAPGYLSTFYDAYNPDARLAFWKSLDEKLFSKGFDAWWLDATEPDIHSNVSLEERKSTLTPNYYGTGEEFFNTYSLLQAKGVYEGQRNTDPDKRVFILTRSAFAGQQHYGAVTWSGDIVTRWEDFRDQVAAGINMSVSGIPYWTTDIGGFSVERRYENPSATDLKEWREINLRWYQFGVFCPIFRIHGQYPFREIYNLAPENSVEYKSMVYYDQLRYRLMPYIYSLAAASYHENGVIMRALVMDFGHDKNVLNIPDQFMFGKSLLVNPVGYYGQRDREVYLPSEIGWYDFYSGKYLSGGQKVNAAAPLEKIPLFVKAGSIIPAGPEIQYTMEPTDGTINLYVYTGDDASFTLYEDEGINYNYEKGEFSSISFNYNEKEKTLIIGDRAGSFDNMQNDREIRLFIVNPDSPKAFDPASTPDQVMKYSGNKISIIF